MEQKVQINEGFTFIVLFGSLTAPAKTKGSSLVFLSGGEGNYFRKAFFIIFYKNERMYIPLICRWEIYQFSNYHVVQIST